MRLSVRFPTTANWETFPQELSYMFPFAPLCELFIYADLRYMSLSPRSALPRDVESAYFTEGLISTARLVTDARIQMTSLGEL